jgi:(1->4)-alpha-D-glucan 1-alpha-D-glucosylmutase
VGVWPLAAPDAPAPDAPAPDAAALAVLRERVEEYMTKAAREAELQTTWVEPDAEFEEALCAFVRTLVVDPGAAPFRAELDQLVRRIGGAGLWNALARTLVHLTAPGTPDIYQGDELWNFALVDPDNRRAVDYERRARLLDEIVASAAGDRSAYLRELVASAPDGRIKLLVVHAALAARAAQPTLFTRGDYVPLVATGPQAGHVFAFARVHGDEAAVVAVPRLLLTLAGGERPPLGELWAGTTLALPDALASLRFADALAGGERRPSAVFRIDQMFADAPLALLVAARD